MTNQANGQATDSSPSLLQRLQRTRDRHLGDSLLGAVLLALRPDLALALTLPALVGAVIGGWWVGAFDWVRFIFGVGGVLVAAIALQVLMAYQDFEQSSTRGRAPRDGCAGKHLHASAARRLAAIAAAESGGAALHRQRIVRSLAGAAGGLADPLFWGIGAVAATGGGNSARALCLSRLWFGRSRRVCGVWRAAAAQLLSMRRRSS
jgi:hypothetical protein